MEKINEDIVFYAFRYCLGRRTSAVSACTEYLKEHWWQLKAQTKHQIQKEIVEAIDSDRAGMDIDIRDWKTISNLCIKEVY